MRYSDVNLLSAKPKWLIQTCNDLALDEGFREFAYPDPLSKLGQKYKARKWNWGFAPADMLLAKYGERMEDGRPWTIGYGETKGVTPSSRTNKQIEDRRLEQRVLDHLYIVEKLIPNWQQLPHAVITVVVNMAYNMGERLYKFEPTFALIRDGHFQEAAARLRKSLWYKQVKGRAERLCRRLETGQIEPDRKVV